MTISRAQWMLLGIAAFAAVTLLSTANAKDDLSKSVRKVLSAEAQFSGSQWNRRQQLGEELVKAKNTDEELYWQAGFVKVNGKWLPFEESLSPEPVSGNVRDYLDRRAKSEHTWQSQSALASWCSQHSLGEQNQAHLYHGMTFAPTDANLGAVYQRMGYVRVGSQWLSQQEAFDARSDLSEYLDQLESGTPTVKRFADEFDAGRVSEISRRQRVKQLAISSKIAALELVLAPRSERCGQAAVEALQQIPTYLASEALGRISAFSPWLFVRDSAIDSLKSRRTEHFVPQLLSLMRTPVTSEFQRITLGRTQGLLCLFRRERESEIDINQLLVWVPPDAGGPSLPRVTRFNTQQAAFYAAQVQTALRRTRDQLESASFTENDQVEVVNERVCEALRRTTHQVIKDVPQSWWDWWQTENGFPVISARQKKVTVVKEDNRLNVRRLIAPIQELNRGPSCLIAGTPIHTERGLVAVERIQTGDRVLSKNIETGELAYKVVLHTTVREPSPITKLTVGDETICATEGHRFWSSGNGWIKTRELTASQPLHTPIGAVQVASTESAEPAPTYNLVVADFHTYFVGKNAILSHDVLPPKPTNKRVPGLSED